MGARPEEDSGALVDSSAGTSVRRVSGEGWVEVTNSMV
jgi:hypothetical protein